MVYQRTSKLSETKNGIYEPNQSENLLVRLYLSILFPHAFEIEDNNFYPL